MDRCITGKGLVFASAVVISILLPRLSQAEPLVAWDVSTRVVLAFQVSGHAVQKWLPSGWEVSPVAAGPSKGANLFLGFVERMLNLDPDGKPIAGGMDRYLGLVVPVRQSGAEKPVNLVIRLYQSNPASIPGAYKNALPASVVRAQSRQGSGTNPTDGREIWEVKDSSGGLISVRFKYHGATLVRSKQEPRYYSAVDPDFYRIYLFEQTVDVVMSVPTGIDRVEDLALQIAIPELPEMIDGGEQLISVTVVPWYTRQVFLP